MPTPIRILAFAGSARRESFNRKFLAVAADAARAAGCEVTVIDLNEYELPLYHGDLEDKDGLPPNAARLITLITSHQGLLVASPEYNSMITPLLKNTIDWCTRADDNPFESKVAAVISASPGALGAVRSLVMAQTLLMKLGCIVVPGQCHLANASKAFDGSGKLIEGRNVKSVEALVAKLFQITSKFRD
ncbi:MAG TPA: NAD(P)H-dependent oxidoreductase [Opitutaceae bacterium]|jgi:NAD(P)H-dependent FMN reductase|nr:NAD(P)H-dependent oxidoreductase [Opitutaceae bacterium]